MNRNIADLARELSDVIRNTAYRDGAPTGPEGDGFAAGIDAGARATMIVLRERGLLFVSARRDREGRWAVSHVERQRERP